MDPLNPSQHDEGFAKRSLHNLIYCNLASPNMDPAEIQKIIGEDPRHLNVVVLSEEDEIRDRLFPDWDLELVEAAEIGDVLKNALKEASDENKNRCFRCF
jgi:hypothetical protein